MNEDGGRTLQKDAGHSREVMHIQHNITTGTAIHYIIRVQPKSASELSHKHRHKRFTFTHTDSIPSWKIMSHYSTAYITVLTFPPTICRPVCHTYSRRQRTPPSWRYVRTSRACIA